MTDSKIRVLIGANDLVLAGVQRLVMEQLEKLDRERFDIALVVLRQFPGKATFDDRLPKDIRVYRLDFKRLFDLSEWRKLMSILRKERPRVVKTATFFSNTVFLLLRPWYRYQVIAAEHNTVVEKRWWQRTLDRILLPHAFTVVGDSKEVADFVSKSEGIPREKFTVVYNGVNLHAIARAERDFSSSRSRLRAEYGIPEHAYVFLTVARLVKQKNHVLMVEAFAKVASGNPDAYLLIAGDGGLRKEIEAKAEELTVSERVILAGEQKDVYQFYAISDAFLLTSRHEGFCIAAMEGLAFGMPLISTRVAGVSEYLEDGVNGFFTDHEADDIAAKMKKVIELPEKEKARMHEAGKDTASRYSIERYGHEINELFAKAAR